MKLYYSPLACSLADHIALLEAGAAFERESVDIKTKRTASGTDFHHITSKGYVPALLLDNGELLTENIAILDWISTRYPALGVTGPLGRTRVLEALTFISTEVHSAFKPMWRTSDDAQKAQASKRISSLYDTLAQTQAGDFLFGARPSVADFYLFVTLLWAERFGVRVPEAFVALRRSMASRSAVQAALREEGLLDLIEPNLAFA